MHAISNGNDYCLCISVMSKNYETLREKNNYQCFKAMIGIYKTLKYEIKAVIYNFITMKDILLN